MAAKVLNIVPLWILKQEGVVTSEGSVLRIVHLLVGPVDRSRGSLFSVVEVSNSRVKANFTSGCQLEWATSQPMGGCVMWFLEDMIFCEDSHSWLSLWSR